MIKEKLASHAFRAAMVRNVASPQYLSSQFEARYMKPGGENGNVIEGVWLVTHLSLGYSINNKIWSLHWEERFLCFDAILAPITSTLNSTSISNEMISVFILRYLAAH